MTAHPSTSSKISSQRTTISKKYLRSSISSATTKTSAEQNGQQQKLFLTSALVLVGVLATVCVLYQTIRLDLPDSFVEKDKMQIIEVVLRIFYYYPVKMLGSVGHFYQLHWTRNVVDFGSWLIGPKSISDADLTIKDLKFEGVSVRVYVPRGERRTNGATIFIHGGGFVVLNVNSYEAITRKLAKETNSVLISIDYRLAPEHMFPAGLEDCEKVVRYFLRTGHKDYDVDPSKVIIMGDSAGGNLAAVVTHRLKDRPEPVQKLPKLKGQLLIYPVLQFLDFQSPSYQQFHNKLSGSAFVDPEALARWLLLYLSIEPTQETIEAVLRNNHTSPVSKQDPRWDHVKHEHLPDHFLNDGSYVTPPDSYGNPQVFEKLEPYLFHPDFCPICAEDVSDLPEALIVTAEFDILRDDGVWYHRRLQQSGVRSEWKHYPNAFHAFINFHPHLELGRLAISHMGEWIVKQIDQ